ncbi:RNA polymerase sigma factor [Paraferrimonas sedimenticola]|uniref:RNA polymerase subunit sigma-24 n=1 Tax=Paraferrimonas sedimenticola TaxID=375674 RepID=A0AA37RSI9_9GAMM|nr:RNA polymerase sigma factor [Paraferrimonas sedimenticola]GLP95160.1 RNA polymerase subunit sigma-24 [Paraferrimonas sedimenticola]
MSVTQLNPQAQVSEEQQNEWIQAAQRGDVQAFQSLYRVHLGRIYALCYRLAGDADLAQDFCQDAFIRIWQKLSMFNGESRFSTWAHRLTVNLCLNKLKAQKTWWQRFVPMDSAPEAQASVDPNTFNGVDKLLPKLPQQARVVFVLHAVEGYKHTEVAQMLNIQEGTSKAQYHRARKLLQEMLK